MSSTRRSARPIDDAMAKDRADKLAIRRDWVHNVVSRRHTARNGEPLYLTLPGRAGHEISMLIEAGVLRRAETGAIHNDDLDLVVAIENDSEAVLDLKSQFPGLRVIGRSVLDLMGSDNPLSFGSIDDRPLCRAVVMNLDFNGFPMIKVQDGQLMVRELSAIQKLAAHHGHTQHIDWMLFLTFNATQVLSPEVLNAIMVFLKANMDEEPTFSQDCKDLFSPSLLKRIIDGQDGGAVTDEERQQLLMAFIPKKIAHLTHTHWKVVTIRNSRYGGSNGTAHMVTFSIEFHWDGRGTVEVYREALQAVLSSASSIEPDGTEKQLVRN
jgi:hypothetical protein